MKLVLLLCCVEIAVSFVIHRPSISTSRASWTSSLRRLSSTTRLHQSAGVEQGSSFPTKRSVQHKDIVVIGGGLAGLSTALYLTQVDPDRHVTILEREEISQESTTTVASFAAAGMLAPQSERLPQGPLLDLCLASRACYRDFVDLVQDLASQAGPEAQEYLTYGDGADVGYVASGGFLAPAFAGDNVATWSPPDETAVWLDATQVREMEPHLHPDVVGGWWFPEDASIDARKLTCSLRAACVAAGVDLKVGPEYEVSSLDLLDGKCQGVHLQHGKYMKTKAVLVANGAWMRHLLPVPVEPHKGQSLSLRMPKDEPPMLQRVLFAQDSYIVPKSDGRIVVGATVEAGSFDPNVTPAGLLHILHHAMQLVPGLNDLPIEETWVGLRPTTPDKGPILGSSGKWSNVFLAGGYWRNGVLLAPKTAQLLAQVICDQELSQEDTALLGAFSWDRFTSPEGSKEMELNARFAASFNPVHRRAKGSGVAAAVGTELGSYSTARTAGEERARDRDMLFSLDSDDALNDSLEQAARMGKEDGQAYSGFDRAQDANLLSESSNDLTLLDDEYASIGQQQPVETVAFEGSADAYTVQVEEDDNDISVDNAGRILMDKTDVEKISSPSYPDVIETDDEELSDLYKQIQSNKAASTPTEMASEENESDDEDPGFRINYVDPVTGKEYEVPPGTPPDEMARRVAEINKKNGVVAANSDDGAGANGESTPIEPEEYSETTYDGYSVIEQANGSASREEELEAMRAARQSNFLDDVDVSQIGVRLDEDGVDVSGLGSSDMTTDKNDNAEEAPSPPSYPDVVDTDNEELSDLYKQIQSNKAASTPTEMASNKEDDNDEDPGFRIYYVDPVTEKEYEVPPGTPPDEMARRVAELNKKNGVVAANGDDVAGASADGESTPIEPEEYSETTYDGYSVIEQANGSASREEELNAMRAARQKNLADDVDVTKIGVRLHDDDE